MKQKKIKRIGRGPGGGSGKYCGRGTGGQKSRTGAGIRLYFEGGQLPFVKKIPKKGFTNANFKKNIFEITTDSLIKFFPNKITKDFLIEKRVIKRGQIPKIILGKKQVTSLLICDSIKCSASVKKLIVQ